MNTENINVQIPPSATENIEKLLGDFDFDRVIASVTAGKFSLDSGGILNNIISLFLGELKWAFLLIGSVIAVILIGSFIKNLDNSFGKNDFSRAGEIAIFLYIATISATAFGVVTA